MIWILFACSPCVRAETVTPLIRQESASEPAACRWLRKDSRFSFICFPSLARNGRGPGVCDPKINVFSHTFLLCRAPDALVTRLQNVRRLCQSRLPHPGYLHFRHCRSPANSAVSLAVPRHGRQAPGRKAGLDGECEGAEPSACPVP